LELVALVHLAQTQSVVAVATLYFQQSPQQVAVVVRQTQVLRQLAVLVAAVTLVHKLEPQALLVKVPLVVTA
jgi:hypothetical protein